MGQKKVITKTAPGETAAPKNETKTKAVSKIEGGKIFIYINATYNNTMITAADRKGDVLGWVSAGSLGFSGPKKATPFAASKVAEALLEKLKELKSLEAEILVRGVGSGRDSALRTLANLGLNIQSIKDMTPIPHNGPKPPKVRRV